MASNDTTPNLIQAFMLCGACIKELPVGQSPATYSSLSVGLTQEGHVQVWCKRHNMNVVVLEPSPSGPQVPMKWKATSSGRATKH